VANIASHVHRKDKFIGIRFFYPVPQTIVAEITRTVETSDETVKKVTDWVTSLGKYPVQLTDAPGGGGIIHRLPHFQKAFSQLSRGNGSQIFISGARFVLVNLAYNLSVFYFRQCAARRT